MNIAEKVGVILVNLGTPNSTSEQDVRTYLAEFLSDKDVIRLPRFFWLPLLRWILYLYLQQKACRVYFSYPLFRRVTSSAFGALSQY